MIGMNMGAVRNPAGITPTRAAAEYKQMNPGQRDSLMSRMGADQRAATMNRLNPEQKAEAMYKMSPSQRAETLSRMSPESRTAFMGPQGARLGTNAEARPNAGGNLRRNLAVGAGVAAVGALGASRMINRNENPAAMERGNAAENRSTNLSGTRGERAVGQREPFTNPRTTNRGGEANFSPRAGGRLTYGAGATRIPHGGDTRSGLPGSFDPGGYLRGAPSGSHFLNAQYARSQFASANPNFASVAAANYQNAVQNRASWPWQLPPYAPGWFNGNPNNYWWQTGWNNGWSYGPSWYNGWGGSLPWWMALADVLPWGMNSQLDWVPYQSYYNGYTYDNETYPMNYFGQNGYCPTQYVFDVASGQFWVPGRGYTDYLPNGYHAPISVAVEESVPQYNVQGQIVGYRLQKFHYNAYWNDQQQAYGYYDYRQQFHWLTFPWLNSWSGEQ